MTCAGAGNTSTCSIGVAHGRAEHGQRRQRSIGPERYRTRHATRATMPDVLELDDQIDRLPARRVPRHRGLRSPPTRARRCASAPSRSSTRGSRPASARSSPPTSRSARATASSSTRRVDDLVLLRGGGVRRRPASCARTRSSASTRSATPCTTSTRCSRRSATRPELAAVAADIGLRRRARAAEHVHLQAAAHRRRGRLPPGRHVPVHRPDDASPASGSPSRTPRSTTAACGRSPGGHRGPLRQRVQARRRRPTTTARRSSRSTTRRCPTPPDDLVPLAVPAGTLVVLHGLLPHWSDVNRSPASRHAYSAALHLGRRRLPGVELAAAPGRHAAAARSASGGLHEPTRPRLIRAGAEGAAPRPPRRWACARRRSSSWPRSTATRTCRPPTSTSWPTWFNRGAKRNDLVLYLETFAHTVGVMQHRDAIERVASECAAGPRRRRRRVRRGALRARAAHRGGADPRRGDARRCSTGSPAGRPAPT